VDGSALDLRIALDAGHVVTGRVVTRGGRALEGATVHTVAGPDADASEVLTPDVGTPADRDGRFAVRVDPTSPGTLIVSHPTHATRRVPLDVARGGERLVELTPAVVVWFRPRPADRPRLSGAHVLWTSGVRSGQASLGGPARTARPDATRPALVGPVELPLDPAGTPVSLRLTVPGHLPWAEELAPTDAGGEERVIDLVLERDPAAGAVEVRLEAPDGSSRALPPDAIVEVNRTDGGPAPPFTRATDAAGATTLDGLPAGLVRIRVWPGDLGPADLDVAVVAGTTVVARARATVEARLRVRVSGTGGRRALVRVLSAGMPAQPRVAEDPSGTARLERVAVSGVPSVVVLVGEEGVTFGGLPGGPHRVEVVSPDVRAAPVEVQLAPGETVGAEVVGTVR
jgi:hypothetical protein